MIQFAKTICTVAALGLGMAALSPVLAQTAATTTEKPAAKPKKTAAKPAEAAPAGPAVFPTAVDAKFAKEKPATAKLKTCAAQYKANKATNSNGGLKWIVKGGGYWSECSKKIGAAA